MHIGQFHAFHLQWSASFYPMHVLVLPLRELLKNQHLFREYFCSPFIFIFFLIKSIFVMLLSTISTTILMHFFFVVDLTRHIINSNKIFGYRVIFKIDLLVIRQCLYPLARMLLFATVWYTNTCNYLCHRGSESHIFFIMYFFDNFYSVHSF